MTNKERDNISKFLSLILRHKPEEIGLILDNEGWANTDKILNHLNISIQNLLEVVEFNEKKRFTLSKDYLKIRANQGHSINVDLNLTSIEPPKILYHGTAEKNIPSIFQEGILKQNRNYVHLSDNIKTAEEVAMRYGNPIVLEILALDMYENKHSFFKSENNVWLTSFVPNTYIKKG